MSKTTPFSMAKSPSQVMGVQPLKEAKEQSESCDRLMTRII